MARVLKGSLLLVLMATQGPARADAPPLIPIQGVLSDDAGVLLEGNVSMVISVYQSSTGGTALYSEALEVQVTNGLFTVYLGSGQAVDLSLFSQTGEVWLGIQVESDTEMARLRLGSVPYSGYAEYTRGPTLAHLSCTTDQVARWNGSAWECADASQGPTLADLACATDQVARWNGSAWECADASQGPTLADLACSAGQIPRWSGSAWECADLTVPLPSLDITLASWFGDGGVFADGVTVTCPAGYRRVGCGHYCTDGPEDTTSWPVDDEGCRGHESLNSAHGGDCHLYAICARIIN